MNDNQDRGSFNTSTEGKTAAPAADRKYRNWYKIVLIILLIFPIFSAMISFYEQPFILIILVPLFIACIIGLSTKKRWGAVLVMISAVYSILTELMAWIPIIGSILAIWNRNLTSVGRTIIITTIVIAFTVPIAEFILALMEYNQLGNTKANTHLKE